MHDGVRTEEACVHWIRAFLRFHGRRQSRGMGGPQVENFLSRLSTERGVSVSTHRQALSALLFLYRQVLGQQLPWMESIGRPQRKPRLPVVLSPAEVAAVLSGLEGTRRVLAQLLDGIGMRIAEALQLRVKDVDFDRRVIVVRHGKGGRAARRCCRPRSPGLARADAARARTVGGRRPFRRRRTDARRARARASACRGVLRLVPGLSPGAALGVSLHRCRAPPPLVRPDLPARLQACGSRCGHRAPGHAAHAAPRLRHAPAAIGHRTVQELLGHADVGTTTICTHVPKAAACGARRPPDALAAGDAVRRPGQVACAAVAVAHGLPA